MKRYNLFAEEDRKEFVKLTLEQKLQYIAELKTDFDAQCVIIMQEIKKHG
jgi:hypothetical protein